MDLYKYNVIYLGRTTNYQKHSINSLSCDKCHCKHQLSIRFDFFIFRFWKTLKKINLHLAPFSVCRKKTAVA